MESIKTTVDDNWLNSVLDGLAAQHPDAAPELVFTNPYELLIATILSAQCTDKQVNKCTPALFERYPDARAMAEAEPEEIPVVYGETVILE